MALTVSAMTVHYRDAPALWDISCEVPRGRLVGILGPNGAGKSTLMKAVLGLIKPISGSVRLLGQPVKQMRKRIAYIPQKEAIDWDFPITVRELVCMGRYPRYGLFRWQRREDVAAAMHCLQQVGMSEYADRQISQLSGGQQQRAFLARALLQDADLYFLDEPLVGVDHASEEIIMELLRGLQHEEKTIFMVHHNLDSAERYFDWVLLLNVQLIVSGPLETTFTRDHLAATYGKHFVMFDKRLCAGRDL